MSDLVKKFNCGVSFWFNELTKLYHFERSDGKTSQHFRSKTNALRAHKEDDLAWVGINE